MPSRTARRRRERWIPKSGVPSSLPPSRRGRPRVGDVPSLPRMSYRQTYSLREQINYERAYLMYVEPSSWSNSPAVFSRKALRENDPDRTWSNKKTVEDLSTSLAAIVAALAFDRGVGRAGVFLKDKWITLAATAENAAYMNSGFQLYLQDLAAKDVECHEVATEMDAALVSLSDAVESGFGLLDEVRTQRDSFDRAELLLQIAYIAQLVIRLHGERTPSRGVLKFQ